MIIRFHACLVARSCVPEWAGTDALTHYDLFPLHWELSVLLASFLEDSIQALFRKLRTLVPNM